MRTLKVCIKGQREICRVGHTCKARLQRASPMAARHRECAIPHATVIFAFSEMEEDAAATVIFAFREM